uniref:Uncharacterized protein n=1 Tax=Setaria digitata TaxID=48799 RepID=A0A915Q6L6_9BILA
MLFVDSLIIATLHLDITWTAIIFPHYIFCVFGRDILQCPLVRGGEELEKLAQNDMEKEESSEVVEEPAPQQPAFNIQEAKWALLPGDEGEG